MGDAVSDAVNLYPKAVGFGNRPWIDRNGLGRLRCLVGYPVLVGFPGQVVKFGSNCPLLAVNETA